MPFILESHDIIEIPTNKVTQMIIRAMQSCEKINGPSDESFQANLLSGYPRCKKDISDYMAKVIQERLKLLLSLLLFFILAIS